MHYTFPQKVLFKHCDPAGIVFFPRFFEMMNDAVEAMFSDLLDWPFEDVMHNHGTPTAAISTRFKAPSRHGDMLLLHVTIGGIGRSSLTLHIRAENDDTLCFEADQTLVCVLRESGRPTDWPEHVRKNVEKSLETTA